MVCVVYRLCTLACEAKGEGSTPSVYPNSSSGGAVLCANVNIHITSKEVGFYDTPN